MTTKSDVPTESAFTFTSATESYGFDSLDEFLTTKYPNTPMPEVRELLKLRVLETADFDTSDGVFAKIKRNR